MGDAYPSPEAPRRILARLMRKAVDAKRMNRAPRFICQRWPSWELSPIKLPNGNNSPRYPRQFLVIMAISASRERSLENVQNLRAPATGAHN